MEREVLSFAQVSTSYLTFSMPIVQVVNHFRANFEQYDFLMIFFMTFFECFALASGVGTGDSGLSKDFPPSFL